ncbi:Endoplasmic reticulum oxidoreductin-1 [Penicillium tannophilum]|nr:Endoplasmic reticulum oxidoreductin-1 [Penicillium tannophilum]
MLTMSKNSTQRNALLIPQLWLQTRAFEYGTINKLNDDVYSLLHTLTTETDFFSYYRLNLFNTKCFIGLMPISMCGNIACSVNTIESEEDIPLTWRSEELSN